MITVYAILYILLLGEEGESYNVANTQTYISAKELAYFVKSQFNPDIKVYVESRTCNEYAPSTKLRLSTKKLEKLGWYPHNDLLLIYQKLILFLKENMK